MAVDVNRRAEMRRRRRRQQLKMRMLLIGLLLIGLLVLAIALKGMSSPVNKKVTIEAGSAITMDKFLAKKTNDAGFVTAIDSIDTTQLGEQTIVLQVKGKTYEATLEIVDTTKPTATPADVKTQLGVVPDAAACVTDIVDMSAVTVSYKSEPDVTKGGETTAVVLLTDAAGNKSEISVNIMVIEDSEAPVITGAEDIEIFVGDSVSYKTGVVVTDNTDENPTLTIDNSRVNLEEAGDYEVIYTATDAAGNSSSVTIVLHVKEKPAGYVEPEKVYEMARNILDQITSDNMSDMEVAFAIYRWTLTSIGYTGSSDKSSWTIGAYQAFNNRSGDCYNYYAAAKALFDVAGIENVDIVKSDTSHSRHYWSLINLGDGWYHVDCTPRKGTGDNFFMVTDEELLEYSRTHDNSHVFDSSLYPERATTSVQDKVNYGAGTLR